MATNTGGGTTASLSNTPQAQADTYTETEDFFGVTYFNVMSNDLAGNAKVLWSVDDGTGSPTDLIMQDTGYAEATSSDYSANGAKIWITSTGQVGYDASTLNPVFEAELQALNPGQTLSDSFTYAIRMSNGTLSWTTVTVVYTGVNDPPVAHADTNAADPVVEAGISPGNAPYAGDPSAAGNVLANDTDVDSGSVLKVTQVCGSSANVGAVVQGVYGSVTISSNGSYAYTLNNSDPDTQALAQGQTATETFTYVVSDQYGATSSTTLTITITGTNDAPDISVGGGDSASASLTETDSALMAAGTLTVMDPDTTDTVNVGVTSVAASGTGGTGGLTNAQLLAMLQLSGNVNNAGDGTAGSLGWSFNSTPQAFNYLAQGETLVLTYTLTADDGYGGSDTQTVTVTINGTNDAPVVAAALSSAADEGSGSYQLDLLQGASDPDDGETQSLSVSNVSYQVDGGASSATAPSGVSLAGSILTVDPGDPSFNHLALGESTTITVTYDVTDVHGAVVQQTETVTINGTNDAPVVSSAIPDQSSAEDTAWSYSVPAGTFTDVDDGTVLTYTATLGDGSALPSWLTFNTATQTFSGTPPANFNGDISLKVTASDGITSTSDTFTLHVTAVDDAPVNTLPASFATNEDTPVQLSGLSVSDVDAGTGTISVTLSVASGTLTATSGSGVTVSGSGTGTIVLSGTIADINSFLASSSSQPTYIPVANANGAVTLTMTTNDGGNTGAGGPLSDTDTRQINIAAINDAPVNTLPGTFSTITNTSVKLAGLSVSDVDAGSGTISVTLSVTSGTLTASTAGGVTVSGSGSSSIVLSGTLANINAYLASSTNEPTFVPATNATGSVTLTMTTNDGGNTGAGGPLSDTDTSTISVHADAAPVNHITTASFTGAKGGHIPITGVSVSDSDSPNLTVTITVSNNGGTVSVTNPAPGLVQNNSNPSATLVLSGAQSDLNSALSTLTWNAPNNSGHRTLTITTTDGTLSDTDTINLDANPAGIAGSPINLALDGPVGAGSLVTVTISNMPGGWVLNGGTQNPDGSWTVQTTDITSLTVTTPSTYSGAEVLEVIATWTNSDGSTGTLYVPQDNVEAYAPGTPIFAWSGDDTLTGSSGADTFVFSQPIGADTVQNFDVAADKIDLIAYAGFSSFADVLANLSADANGNAVITLGGGQTITLVGVDPSSLTAANFEFDVTPAVENAGTIAIGDGALLPLSGVVDNSGTIALNGQTGTTTLELIQNGITLQGGGHLTLSDSSSNVVSGSVSSVTFDNVDNMISGAGQLGGGSLTLINGGTINASGTNALVIDTGANTIVNSGTIEATGAGGLEILSSVANSGLIAAYDGSRVFVAADVTGSGHVEISGAATVELGGADSNNVLIDANATGVLVLDDALQFGGSISGLNSDDDVDLRDVGFGPNTTLSYSDNGNGTGVLTVTDGTSTVQLSLVGNYQVQDFSLASDGQGGTLLSNSASGVPYYAAGQPIDVSNALSVATGTDVVADGYLRVTTTGLVQVDLNGGGDNWVTLGTLDPSGGTFAVTYLSGGVSTTVDLTPVAPPIGIDLNGDGVVSFLGTNAGVTFDYGYGKVATAWVAPQDGILVRDANGDGQVTANEMVFSTGGSDLQGLAQFDTNGDGKLDAADADFSQFAVWQDSNSNGVVDPGEMKSLTSLGITSISLTSNGIGYSAADGDVSVVGTGSVSYRDGSTGVLADAMFATGGRTSEGLRAASLLPSNPSLLGAVAAAGLMAMPAHAQLPAIARGAAGAWDIDHLHVPVQPVSGEPAQQNHALENETAVSLPDATAAAQSSEISVAHPQRVQEQLDFAGHEHQLPQLGDLLASAGTHSNLPVAQPFAAIHPAAGVSAEMLQAAMAGIAQHNGANGSATVSLEHGQAELGQVLADALHAGAAEKPDVDSLLNAIHDPAHGQSHSSVNEALAMLGSMGHGHSATPLENHTLMAMHETMVMHQVGAPPA